MLFTDTDSVTYEIKTEDIYEDFKKIKIYLILVIYSEDLKFYDPSNMKDIG